MKTFKISAVTTSLLLLLCSANVPPTRKLFQFNYENVLGTSLELKVITGSEEVAILAEQVALDEIDRLNSVLSSYDPNSEFSRWQRTSNTEEKVSPELFEVLMLFDQWKIRTGGALSATAAIASDLWKKAALNQQLPSEEMLIQAVEAMKQPQWILNNEKQTATHLSHGPLVLNSFVKSYIISKASQRIMLLPGVAATVLNIGGDIVVTGDQDERIRISDPYTAAENGPSPSTLSFSNKAIATSGNYRRGFKIGGQWFSHIVDVRTAMPAMEIISATVVADDATDAGALATAFTILSPLESIVLAKKISGVEYLIITKSGERIASDGWRAMEEMTNATTSDKAINSISKNQYEVTIELELARFEGRFRRPFVAVWVENKKKESVRTVVVWYNKPRWLPDLKRWYSKNQSVTRDPATMSSITSATRSAGKYTLTWDGLDDQGKPVPAGNYTLYIEAAREHGTHQLIKQEVDWSNSGKPQHFTLTGGIEITSASLDYHAVKNL